MWCCLFSGCGSKTCCICFFSVKATKAERKEKKSLRANLFLLLSNALGRWSIAPFRTKQPQTWKELPPLLSCTWHLLLMTPYCVSHQIRCCVAVLADIVQLLSLCLPSRARSQTFLPTHTVSFQLNNYTNNSLCPRLVLLFVLFALSHWLCFSPAAIWEWTDMMSVICCVY